MVALYKFPGNSPEDLPFKRGDILTIVQSSPVSVFSLILLSPIFESAAKLKAAAFIFRVPTGPEKYGEVMKFDFSFFRT